MRLIGCFIISLWLISITESAFAADPGNYSHVPLNDLQRAADRSERNLSAQQTNSESESIPDNMILISQKTGLNFIPAMIETDNGPKPVLTDSSTHRNIQTDNHRPASKAGDGHNVEDESGPATLPNALWLFGICVCYILTIQKTRNNAA
jgi:hypothetical protein